MKTIPNIMKHTPGPWKQNKVSGSVLIGTDGSMGFMSIVSVELVGHGKPSLKQYTDESMANANLIAAAPDLLEALEKLLKGRRKGDKERHYWLEVDIEDDYAAEDAIKKAKGL